MTGLGLVSCLDASHGGYSIVTRASLKENKNSFAVRHCTAREIYAPTKLCLIPVKQGSLDIKETI